MSPKGMRLGKLLHGWVLKRTRGQSWLRACILGGEVGDEEAQERLQLLLGPVGHQSALVGPAIHAGGPFVSRVVQQLRPVARRPGGRPQAPAEIHHPPAQGPQDGVSGARVPLERGVVREDVQVSQALDNAEALVAGPGRREHALATHTRHGGSDAVLLTRADDG